MSYLQCVRLYTKDRGQAEKHVLLSAFMQHAFTLKTLSREDYQPMRVSAQMVTIMIGANDFCSHMCYLKNFSFTPQLHEDSLIKALDYLRDNMPRTVINLVPPPREYVRKHTHSLQRIYMSQICAWGLECTTCNK